MSAVIAIIGAGAAGLMAAIHAAAPGVRVVLVERLSDGGRKILISGGGRCNVLPSALDERRFVTASSPHSMRKILRAWPIERMREFFEREAMLPLVLEEATGKLFPVANTSRSVRDALQRLADARHVEWRTRALVKEISPRAEGGWLLQFDDGTALGADAVVLATGGLSVPSTGSDGFAFRALAALGHTIHPTYPALTPLTLDPPAFADLAGVSLDVEVRAASSTEKRSAQGGFLFTHRGYSGPALLDVSHVAVRGRLAGEQRAQLHVSWSRWNPAQWRARLAPGPGQVATVIRRELPARLSDRLLHEAGVVGDTALSRFDRDARERLIAALTAFPLPWTSDEGYKKAEVTGGGVALEEVQPATLESRIHKGLFLAGELLDAFGPIGGYNFTWAWVTGRQAGLGALHSVQGEK
jgi:predicted Rossmann fold flavoprotein